MNTEKDIRQERGILNEMFGIPRFALYMKDVSEQRFSPPPAGGGRVTTIKLSLCRL